jgi:hypothetical protein
MRRPKIAGEVKEPPASKVAGEGDRTHCGRVRHQALPAMRLRVTERVGLDADHSEVLPAQDVVAVGLAPLPHIRR